MPKQLYDGAVDTTGARCTQRGLGTCMYADILKEVDGALATRSVVRYYSNALHPAHFGELPP